MFSEVQSPMVAVAGKRTVLGKFVIYLNDPARFR